MRDYQLPSRSIAPSPSSEVEMELAFNKMAAIAADQKLIFDGSRSSRGIIVVGRQGANGPMIVAVAIVPKSGYVALLDARSMTRGMRPSPCRCVTTTFLPSNGPPVSALEGRQAGSGRLDVCTPQAVGMHAMAPHRVISGNKLSRRPEALMLRRIPLLALAVASSGTRLDAQTAPAQSEPRQRRPCPPRSGAQYPPCQ